MRNQGLLRMHLVFADNNFVLSVHLNAVNKCFTSESHHNAVAKNPYCLFKYKEPPGKILGFTKLCMDYLTTTPTTASFPKKPVLPAAFYVIPLATVMKICDTRNKWQWSKISAKNNIALKVA